MKIRWLWLSQPFDQLTGSKRMGTRTPGPGRGNARTLQRPKTTPFGASINSFYLFFFKSFSFSFFFLSLGESFSLFSLLFRRRATVPAAADMPVPPYSGDFWRNKWHRTTDRDLLVSILSFSLPKSKCFFTNLKNSDLKFFFLMCSVGVFRRCDPCFQRVCL